MKQRERRHPAEVTADRLLTHYEQWFDTRFTRDELDAIGKVRAALLRIWEEDDEYERNRDQGHQSEP